LHSEGVGRGVTSTVELPFAAAGEQSRAPTASGETQPPKNGPSALPDLDGYKVLVLEDDADGREVIVRFLSECRASVKGASSAEEVIEISREHQFDLLISDIGLPNMSGFELIRHLRAGGISMPAIALTAYARSEDRERALEAGFQSHIAKPVDRSELLDRVAALLPQRPSVRKMIS
jgi:CheY-like chemotaxis protein